MRMIERYMRSYLQRRLLWEKRWFLRKIRRMISGAIMSVLLMVILAGAVACQGFDSTDRRTPTESTVCRMKAAPEPVFATEGFAVSIAIPLKYISFDDAGSPSGDLESSKSGSKRGSSGTESPGAEPSEAESTRSASSGATSAGTGAPVSRSPEAVFLLTPEDPGNPMPEGTVQGVKRLELHGSAESTFGQIVCRSPGLYEYTVRREGDDSTVYHLRAIATNDGEGSLIATRDGEKGKTEIVFYEAKAEGGSGKSSLNPGDGAGQEPSDGTGVDPPDGTIGKLVTGSELNAADEVADLDERETGIEGGIAASRGRPGADASASGRAGGPPSTGDRAPVVWWIVMMGCSSLCIGGVVLKRRMQRYNTNGINRGRTDNGKE